VKSEKLKEKNELKTERAKRKEKNEVKAQK